MSLDNFQMGLHYVPAYQESGYPFVTASVLTANIETQIGFPSVTRFFNVKNATNSTVLVSFTKEGLYSGNYFSLGIDQSFEGELRVGSIWLSSSVTSNIQIIAGLTGIHAGLASVVTGSGTGY